MVFDLSYRRFLKAYLLLLVAALLCIGLLNLVSPNPWSMGDWLINYSAGFVRRGLIGQFALLVSSLTHTTVFIPILIVQWTCYAIFLWSVWVLLRGMAWPLWMILLVYSPATLSMILLYPAAAYRKEILFQAILCVVVAMPPRFKLNGIVGQVLVPAAVFLSVLSHEALAFFLPYLLAVYLLRVRDSLISGLVSFIPTALAGAAAFLLAALRPGNGSTASTICSSIGAGRNPAAGLCSGAIFYLSHDRNFARLDTLAVVHYWHGFYEAPYMFLWAAVPVLMAGARLSRTNRYDTGVVAVCAAAAWIGSIALFVYGSDWDRWISIHTFCSMMLLLMIEKKRQTIKPEKATSWRLPEQPGRRYPAIAFLLFMTCGWQCAFTHHFPLPFDRLHDYVKYQRAALNHSSPTQTLPLSGG